MTATGPANSLDAAGSLQPVELAQASVMAALCAATAIIAVVVPFAAALSLLGTVPMGLLAYRYRLRVLIAATVAGGTIAFLIAGMGGFMTVIDCAYIGGLTGIVKRRGRGTPTVFVAAHRRGALFGVASVLALTILSRLRNLIFDTMTANINGVAAVIARFPDMEAHRRTAQTRLRDVLHYWPFLIGASSVLSITIVTLIGWWALSRVLARLFGIPDVHKLDLVAPKPGRWRPCRRGCAMCASATPRADHDALGPVSLSVEPGEHLAVTGANGSGKTTLMLVLAGREPTSGRVERPGAVGLGGSAAPPSSCSTRKARCWVPGWPTTSSGGCRPARAPMSTGCSPRWAWTGWPNGIPAACPAANCSGSRWPPRWRASLHC